MHPSQGDRKGSTVADIQSRRKPNTAALKRLVFSGVLNAFHVTRRRRGRLVIVFVLLLFFKVVNAFFLEMLSLLVIVTFIIVTTCYVCMYVCLWEQVWRLRVGDGSIPDDCMRFGKVLFSHEPSESKRVQRRSCVTNVVRYVQQPCS